MEHTVFEHRTMNDELIEEFNDFFDAYNLEPLFTNEHRTSNINVSYTELKSVINPGGRYRNAFIKFTDYIKLSQDNKQYEDIMFYFIDKPKSIQGLVNQINRAMDYIDTQINDEHQFNKWNIVWYNRYNLK